MVQGQGAAMLSGKYVTIGGKPLDWVKAGLKRITGISLFPKNRELFWVRFPASADALQKLSQLCEEGKVRTVIASVVKLEVGAVRDAFAQLHNRRTVGKLVIQVTNSTATHGVVHQRIV